MAPFIDQDVLRFEVPIQDVVAVQVLDCEDYLCKD